ncbi:MAG: alkaline phosphatase D family protein [Pirellulales bacterium]
MRSSIHVLLSVLSIIMVSGVSAAENQITHGPILGRPGSTQMSVWVRTHREGTIYVDYGTKSDALNQRSLLVKTDLSHDNTGVVALQHLKPDTKYYYQMRLQGGSPSKSGSFKTFPTAETTKNEKYNLQGLFNFSFEFACGNRQYPDPETGIVKLHSYDTLVKDHMGEIDFAILNGDFIYENQRQMPLADWKQQVGVDQAPAKIDLIPSIVGVWENYKLYLERGTSLSTFHRNVPSLFTIDDHEMVNDIAGSGQTGFKERRATFRDIGTQAWIDYLGWSNPMAFESEIHFGQAQLSKDSNVLTDPEADFSKLPLDKMSNLLVHWGGIKFGDKVAASDEYPGAPNAGVYQIDATEGQQQLKISPAAVANGTTPYSIGRRLYGDFKMSNCHFFMLDTRSHRDNPDFAHPDRADKSMLGKEQLAWLKKGITASDADFLFIVSSVNFMIPHTGLNHDPTKIPEKGEAWTVFMHEREELLNFWDELDKPVMLLTGDLHNSFAIEITDNVYEFASGPHESLNHNIGAEGYRPLNGKFQYGPRECNIMWSSYLLPDTPREMGDQPHFCVIQLNNVTNNPITRDEDRWVAFPHPQVVIQYYDGKTGRLKFAHTISK